MTPLQKLVWPATERAFLESGSSLLAGPAVRIGDAAVWRTAGEVLTAYGFDPASAPSVDVLRFAPSPLTRVSIPTEGDPSWTAGYELGFLRGSPVPVWDVAATTLPQDAEIWRIHADGRQDLVAAYGGPAIGWRGTGVYAPPTMLVGPRAVWEGRDWVASWVDPAHIELVAISESPIDGFVETRPHVFSRVVEKGSCSRIFELSFTAVWRGIRCTLLQSNTEEAAVLLATDADSADELGAVPLEPGVYWHLVPRSELSEMQGVSREVSPA